MGIKYPINKVTLNRSKCTQSVLNLDSVYDKSSFTCMHSELVPICREFCCVLFPPSNEIK